MTMGEGFSALHADIRVVNIKDIETLLAQGDKVFSAEDIRPAAFSGANPLVAKFARISQATLKGCQGHRITEIRIVVIPKGFPESHTEAIMQKAAVSQITAKASDAQQRITKLVVISSELVSALQKKTYEKPNGEVIKTLREVRRALLFVEEVMFDIADELFKNGVEVLKGIEELEKMDNATAYRVFADMMRALLYAYHVHRDTADNPYVKLVYGDDKIEDKKRWGVKIALAAGFQNISAHGGYEGNNHARESARVYNIVRGKESKLPDISDLILAHEEQWTKRIIFSIKHLSGAEEANRWYHQTNDIGLTAEEICLQTIQTAVKLGVIEPDFAVNKVSLSDMAATIILWLIDFIGDELAGGTTINDVIGVLKNTIERPRDPTNGDSKLAVPLYAHAIIAVAKAHEIKF